MENTTVLLHGLPVEIEVFIYNSQCSLELVVSNDIITEKVAEFLFSEYEQELEDLANAQLTKVQEERKISKYGKKLLNQAYEDAVFLNSQYF